MKKFRVFQYADGVEPSVSDPIEAEDMAEAVEFFILSGNAARNVHTVKVEEIRE